MRKSARTGLLAALALSATALIGLLGPTSASAASGTNCVPVQKYPVGTQAEIQTSTTTPKKGGQFKVSGVRYLGSEDVKIYVGGTVTNNCDPASYHGGIFVGTGHTNQSGAFDPTVTFPSSLSGSQLLVGIGASGKGYDFDYLQLTVAGSNSGGGGGSQPPANTGVDIALMLSAAGILIAGGVVFTRSGRRRRLAAR